MNPKAFLLSPGKITVAMAVGLAVLVLPSMKKLGSEAKAASTSTANAATLEARNNNAFAQMFGEMRAGAADFMFVKTERYLHSGVEFAPHLDAGVMAQSGEVVGEAETHGDGPEREHEHEHDHDHAHDHEHAHHEDHAHELPDESTLETLTDAAATSTLGETSVEVGAEKVAPGKATPENHSHDGDVPTIIRSADKDFRGFLGNLEREVKPWQDASKQHMLASGAELLPWYRLITLSNPHFIRGYRVGGMWLSYEGHDAKALEFLNEGIAMNGENPELFQLYLSKAQVYMHIARAENDRAFNLALETAAQGVELGLKVRSEGGKTGVENRKLVWTDDHEEDFVFLARFVPILLERMHRFDDALAQARRGTQLAPDDAVLARIAERLERGESAYIEGPTR